jgi:ring-1,2-phenylacetyl-CoA epoxidase subunit PaaC
MDALTGDTRHAVVNLLLRMADDELILGHRDTRWTASVPAKKADLPFASIAREEISHAHAYYEMLHELGQGEPEALILTRGPRRFRCASLVCLPDDPSWGHCLIRQFLYDAAEVVRLTALCTCPVARLSDLARRVQENEKRHLAQGRTWVIRLALATDEARQQLQAGLRELYPHALGLFEPTEADETLAQAGICPREEELQQQWESAVAPVLVQAGLDAPLTARAVCGGRVGRHPDGFAELLQKVQDSYHTTS